MIKKLRAWVESNLPARDPQCRAQGYTMLDERRKAEWDEEQYQEHREEQRTGRRVCPSCGQRTVKVSSRHTRQYGGGYDTFEKCENSECDYAEVYV